MRAVKFFTAHKFLYNKNKAPDKGLCSYDSSKNHFELYVLERSATFSVTFFFSNFELSILFESSAK